MNKYIVSILALLLAAGCRNSNASSDSSSSLTLQGIRVPTQTNVAFEDRINPVQPAIDPDKAIDTIIGVVGIAPEGLTFVEMSLMINSPDADWIVAVYEDGLGAQYYFEPSAYRLVQIIPTPINLALGDPKSIQQLRSIAETIASNSPLYNQLSGSLEYDEGSKGEISFFTWTDLAGAGQYNPARLQIGLRQDGELISYLNTLVAE